MKRKTLYIKKILVITTLIVTFLLSAAVISDAAAYNGKYWVKVNAQANVVTVYKKSDGKWKPVRAMLCSVGIGTNESNSTPIGTFYTKGKWQWGHLVDDLWGQYCTHITSDILFHSVYYDYYADYASQPTKEFNKLGSPASHGCVRLSTMDAKWIYDQCKTGTKVTIYKSAVPGPLGKPAGIKVSTRKKRNWDPTDPKSDNPNYLLKKPQITVSSDKKLTVKYGSKYNLKSKITATDPNTFADLTSKIKVYSTTKYSKSLGKYVDVKFSTTSIGHYKIKFKVSDPYCGTSYKTLKINVVDNLSAPVIYGVMDKTIDFGSANAVSGITASQLSCDRTSAIRVHITEPNSTKCKCYSYAKAKAYMFSKEGKYNIKYSVKNKYSPYKESTAAAVITVKPDSSLPPDPNSDSK